MSQAKAKFISDLVQALNFTGTSSAPANGMYLSAANTIKLATNSNGRLTIDSSGNATFTGTCTATTFIGALTGTSTKIDLNSNNDNTAFRVPFTSGNSGSVFLYADNADGMTYNPSTGKLTAQQLQGTLTTAAQTNITSLGTLSNLQIANHLGLGIAGAEFGSGVKTILLQGGSSTKSGCIDFKEYSSGTRLANIFVQNDTSYGMSIGTSCSGQNGDFIRFHTGALGSEKVRITSAGNVGIGTTSPSNLLHVAGVLECSNIKILGTNSFESSANVFEGKGTNGARLRSALSDATVPTFSNKDDTNTGMFLPGSDVLGLTTGGAERLRIDSSGRLLIAKGTASTTTSQIQIGDPAGGYTWDVGDVPQVLIAGVNNESPTSGTLNIALRVADENNNNMFQIHNRGGGNSDVGEVYMAGKVGIGTTSPSEQFHLLKSHNGHTRAVIQNNWGASATAQLKLISPTDEFQLIKYASGPAALNLSNNSRIYHSVGGQVRHQITADTAGQTACVVNTPADGGVNSQYVTATKAASGNYNTFRVTINQSSWGSFFLKVYVSAHDGNSAYKWVTGYMNTGFSTVLNTLSNMSGNFSGGTATNTHISGQTWKYEIITNGGNSSVTHPVMGVELIFGGNGNMLDTGSISLEIS